MRGVDAHGQWQLRTFVDDRAQMFEAMSDAFTLARGVFKQDTQPPELQTSACKFQTARANFYSVCLARTARAAGMHYQIIDAEQDRPLDLLVKRRARFCQDQLISRCEV